MGTSKTPHLLFDKLICAAFNDLRGLPPASADTMKPISLHGHERSITQIKYNREGDLLFSSAKDQHPNVWYSINGEQLGTFDGHGGAVWCLDVDWKTQNFISGAADNTIRLWDVEKS